MLNAVRQLDLEMTGFKSDIAALVSLSEEARGANGSRYFVDNNYGNDAWDGLSWDKPFKTLAAALAISHADIARGSDRWARRNTIYISGDDFVEDLTAFAQKTDIVGMGSSDSYTMPCIRGNHAPVSTTDAGRFMGCRFYNVRFRPTAASDLVTLDSTSGPGIEFRGCIFDAHYGAFTAPSAIDTTACGYVKAIGCDFLGAFSASVIDIGAGSVNGMRIVNNTMLGGAVAGILVTGTTTVDQSRLGLIDGNRIYTVGCTINDGNDDTFIITNNMLVSDAATGTDSLNVDTRWCAGNIITDATKSGPWPRLDDT
jgi:hypothetical protein